MSELADFISAKILEQLGLTYLVETKLPSGRYINVTGGVNRQQISVGLMPEMVKAQGDAGTGDPLDPYTYVILSAEDWAAVAEVILTINKIVNEQRKGTTN